MLRQTSRCSNRSWTPALIRLGTRPIVLLALLALAGCGASHEDPSRPKRVPVSGVVKYQGQPVEGANVSFLHETANSTAYGKTDAAGTFRLTTFVQNDGAVPGPHVVTIRRLDYINKAPPGVDLSAGNEAPPPEIRWIIPQDYSHPAKSGLKADVSETGPNEFLFDLK